MYNNNNKIVRMELLLSFRRSPRFHHPTPRATLRFGPRAAAAGTGGIRKRGKMSFSSLAVCASDVNLHFRKDSKLAHN